LEPGSTHYFFARSKASASLYWATGTHVHASFSTTLVALPDGADLDSDDFTYERGVNILTVWLPELSDQEIEFAISETNTPPGGLWTKGTPCAIKDGEVTITFGNLPADTYRYIFARSAENDDFAAGEPIYIQLKTLPKQAGAVISTPTLSDVRATIITVAADAPANGQTVEFGRNTTNTPPGVWQASGTFAGLIPETQYYFFARAAENATFNAGEPSDGLSVQTLAPPPMHVFARGFEPAVLLREGEHDGAFVTRVNREDGFAYRVSTHTGQNLGLLVRSSWPVDVTPFNYIVFEILAPNPAMLSGIYTLRTRLHTHEAEGRWLDFNGDNRTAPIRNAAANQWVTVAVPIGGAPYEQSGDWDLSRLTTVHLRLIRASLPTAIEGDIYFRNIRFANDPNLPVEPFAPLPPTPAANFAGMRDLEGNPFLYATNAPGNVPAYRVHWSDVGADSRNHFLLINAEDHDTPQNWLVHANRYFMFDMLATDASYLNLRPGGNNWISLAIGDTEPDASPNWDAYRIMINTVGPIRAAEPNTWITVTAQLSWANAHMFNLFIESELQDVRGMRLQLEYDAPPSDTGTVYFRNPRFQCEPFTGALVGNFVEGPPDVPDEEPFPLPVSGQTYVLPNRAWTDGENYVYQIAEDGSYVTWMGNHGGDPEIWGWSSRFNPGLNFSPFGNMPIRIDFNFPERSQEMLQNISHIELYGLGGWIRLNVPANRTAGEWFTATGTMPATGPASVNRFRLRIFFNAGFNANEMERPMPPLEESSRAFSMRDFRVVWDATVQPPSQPGGDHHAPPPPRPPAPPTPETPEPAAPGLVDVTDLDVVIEGEEATVEMTITEITNIVENLLDAIADAIEDDADTEIERVITLDFTADVFKEVTAVTLPADLFEAVGDADLALEIALPQGTITFDADSLATATELAEGEPITISLERVYIPDIQQEQRRDVREADVIIKITVTSGETVIRDFVGTVTVTVPYEGPFPAAVWYLDSEGTLHRRAADCDPIRQTVTFTTTHFSLFIIGEAPPSQEDNHEIVVEQLQTEPSAVYVTLRPGTTATYFYRETILLLVEAGVPLVLQTREGIVTVEMPVPFLAELSRITGGGLYSIDIGVAENNYEMNIAFKLNGWEIPRFDNSFRVLVDIMDRMPENMNIHRLVAISGNYMVGGGFDRNGRFAFDAKMSAAYMVAYVPDLRRLVLNLDSPIITDLAGNAPTQVMDVIPMIVDNRTLVPVRFIANALGGESHWDRSRQEVSVVMEDRSVTFTIGENLPGMDVPAQFVDERTMVPLRFVSEFFGAIVNWNRASRSIEIIY
jgi:hypothetical protein